MKKKVSVIAALSENNVYAQNGRMPWYIPEDFQHFREKTLGCSVIMGRHTYESLPEKFKPLPGRENIVISANPRFVAEDVVSVDSFEVAVARACNDRVFCIGGLNVWYQAMDIASEAWITVVKKQYPVVPGTTLVASRFLHLEESWPDFFLNENPTQTSGGPEKLPFEIRHWVRK